MSELEPGTEESDYDAHSPGRDEYTSVEQEKNPGFLLGAISFVIALLFIIIYFNAGYNSLLLLGAIIFGFAGTLLISSQRGKAKSAATTVPGEQESHQDTEDGLTPFELLVKEALDSIPSEFQGKMDNVLVQVESEPGEELLERIGVNEGHVLLGLYEGMPLTAGDSSPRGEGFLLRWLGVSRMATGPHARAFTFTGLSSRKPCGTYSVCSFIR